MQMGIEHAHTGDVEFVVGVCMNEFPAVLAVHIAFSTSVDSVNELARRSRPRERRDITVPIGRPVTPAISLYDNPSISQHDHRAKLGRQLLDGLADAVGVGRTLQDQLRIEIIDDRFMKIIIVLYHHFAPSGSVRDVSDHREQPRRASPPWY